MTTVKEVEKAIFEARFLPLTDGETVRHAEVFVEVMLPSGVVFMSPVHSVRVCGDGPTKSTPDNRFLVLRVETEALKVNTVEPCPPPADDRKPGNPVEPYWHTQPEHTDFPPDVIKVNPDAASRGMKSESNPGVGGGP